MKVQRKKGDGAESEAGFGRVELPGALVLARRQAIPWVRFVLEGGGTLYRAASRSRDALQLEGRGTVYVIPSPARMDGVVVGAPRWAVRHYVRGGGLVPLLLGDRYLRWGRPRPFHELRASEEARHRGISTPNVMAAALYGGGLFYRADLVTEFIPDSTDLVEALFDTRRKGVGGAVERQDALRAAGVLVARMARAGIGHRDLHAGNILLEWRGAAPSPHLLDLDRCEILRAGKTAPVGPMALRLRRSLQKWERRTGLRISQGEWLALNRGLEG